MRQRYKIVLMLACFTACGIAIFFNNRYQKKNVRPADLYEVINQQLKAFQDNDLPRAYQYASIEFQARFNVTQFSEMIRKDYQWFSDVERVEIGALTQKEENAFLNVYLFGKDGQMLPCIYILRNEHGTWKIEGVKLIRKTPSGNPFSGTRA